MADACSRSPGNKCKYSHDLNQDRKQTKASIYADQRDDGDKKTGGPLSDYLSGAQELILFLALPLRTPHRHHG